MQNSIITRPLQEWLINVRSDFLGVMCVVAFTLGALPCKAMTATEHESPSTLIECGELRVGFVEFGALFFLDARGHFAGIDKDFFDELGKRSKCRFQMRIESHVRLWSQLADGNLDISTSNIITTERKKLAFAIPYFTTRNYVVLDTSLGNDAQQLDSFLANKKWILGTVKGFQHGTRYNELILKLKEQNRIIEVADFPTLIQIFNVKRIHGFLMSPAGDRLTSDKSKLNIKFIMKDWFPQDTFIAGLFLSKRSVKPEIVQLLTQTVREMQRDGSLEKIFARHVGDKLAKEMMLDTSPQTNSQALISEKPSN